MKTHCHQLTFQVYSLLRHHQKREEGLERYKASKRRQGEKEKTDEVDGVIPIASKCDDVVYPVYPN